MRHEQSTQDQIKRDICISLGLNPDNPPLTLNDKDTGKILGVETGTLSVWRSTGRYNLPFTKVGRLVRYPLEGIAAFIASRTYNHTGEA